MNQVDLNLSVQRHLEAIFDAPVIYQLSRTRKCPFRVEIRSKTRTTKVSIARTLRNSTCRPGKPRASAFGCCTAPTCQ